MTDLKKRLAAIAAQLESNKTTVRGITDALQRGQQQHQELLREQLLLIGRMQEIERIINDSEDSVPKTEKVMKASNPTTAAPG